MKKIDPDFVYLKDMMDDAYYPPHLVEKLKNLLVELVHFLEPENKTNDEIQVKCDEVTEAINSLQDEFWENGSEIETVARESICETIFCILKYFDIDIDSEEATRQRDW
ncbi:hypothetical protein DM558_06180 [Entomomonas moraniae]|uniref:Uncharacterized protein n=1 Tax=Entomomonas moraniae TaxID=2213226 RepID=A0A3Q9JM58_9GAMM|nr:DUF5713 family protein [Entomomonas moraniae]AZS50387.1 hypothetical protein DM558_06180 [Entomomonas moraniae]